MNCLLGFPLIYYGFFQQEYIRFELVTTASISFLGATMLLSPDLDLRNSIPTKNWGFLQFIWFGYHLIFRHRGKSHSLLFASLTKIVYLTSLGSFVVSVFIFARQIKDAKSFQEAVYFSQESFGILFYSTFRWVQARWDYFFAALVGIIASDWMHILTDRISSLVKRLRT